MAVISINLIDAIPSEDFKAGLSAFTADDYNNPDVCYFPNSPYDYLLAKSKGSIAYFKEYARASESYHRYHRYHYFSCLKVFQERCFKNN